MILIDAGPLVALVDADDKYHDRCVETVASIREAMVTVWPAFTEAMYLLRSNPLQEALWQILESGTLHIGDLDAGDCARMRFLMHKYRDLPMDLADAALVRVAEREKIGRIFTIDRRDFEIYRPAGFRRFEILP